MLIHNDIFKFKENTMGKNIALIALPLLIIGVAIWGFTYKGGSSQKSEINNLEGLTADVFMSPTCGCCRVFESILSKEGVKTNKITRDNMSAVKQQYKVPEELESCHTTIIAGYVVEGHIPMEAISKLVGEKPAIRGIAMPGMPSGSPGMPGSKSDSFEIFELNDSGDSNIFMTI